MVTDVGMPGMGGLEMAKAAKAIAPTVPVVIVTGWAERDDIASARAAARWTRCSSSRWTPTRSPRPSRDVLRAARPVVA